MPPPPAIREQHNQDSRRARVRIGVAAALLVTAIGILAVLNHRKSEQAPATESAAVPPQTSMSSADLEATPPASTTPAPADPVPATAPAPAEETPPPPVPGKLPQATPPAKPAAAAVPEESTGAETSKPYVASAGKALGQKDMSVVAVQSPSQTPAKPAAAKAFEVQLGVFSDPENAKQLQAKLQEHGIPSHSETKVQLGPFKDRAEADRAREKLKAMGIQAVVVAK